MHAEATANPLTNEIVFGIQPRLIAQSICEAQVLSLKNIQQMVEARNCRDTNIVASTADEMTHL